MAAVAELPPPLLIKSLMTQTLPRYSFLPRMTPPEKSTLSTASRAFENKVCNSMALASALALVNPLVSIPSQTNRMYLNSSYSSPLPPADAPLPSMAGWPKPLEDSTVSDSLVDTTRFKLSAVSMFSDDCSTCTRDAGRLLCSQPWLGPVIE